MTKTTTSRTTLANAIRVLSMDAIGKSNSGHPGAPMGMADLAEVLYNDFIHHNPKNPKWSNRDRFVLSNGHGSMLIYALLHLTGYDLTMEDIKSFRQLHSKTPGHPEYGYTPGVETTTGPLGQGIANAVGMALSEKLLATEFNQAGLNIVDHHTYVFLGDGCLMEGISHEVCSFAGTLKLGKLVAIYDDNNISIDGEVEGWFTDDTVKRFEAYGWHVQSIDGHDPDAIHTAIANAKNISDKPSIICAKTIIGKGSPNKAGSHECHGSPLGDAEIAATRVALGWSHPPFEIPADVYAGWNALEKGAKDEAQWNELFAQYTNKFPDRAADYVARMNNELPNDFSQKAQAFVEHAQATADSMPTRKASKYALEGLGPLVPGLFGGSADLTPSNNTFWSGSKAVNGTGNLDFSGNYLSYGVREFGMTAMMNGMMLHGGLMPYGATFLMFSEYARNALRMAALMKIRGLFVYTHDSIGVGEDGPTHQPVEQTSSLRLIPNMDVWRPCDAVESVVAWKSAIERTDGPSCLIFTRQNTDKQVRNTQQISNIAKGAYILKDSTGIPEVIIIATGSEVGIAMIAAAQFGHKVRVVSMPCTSIFDNQDIEYKESVLPKSVTARVAIESGQGDFWHKYVGLDGVVIAQDTFGESAPGAVLFEHFGFTVKHIVNTIIAQL
ncbi:Transketolase [hydrothermal vent metagenome]|uniref:transketolase n=1 Tax=hydrothermal vent metagenome TaxID=652676 RepID=A0A3B0VFF3_9ZZZZ